MQHVDLVKKAADAVAAVQKSAAEQTNIVNAVAASGKGISQYAKQTEGLFIRTI